MSIGIKIISTTVEFWLSLTSFLFMSSSYTDHQYFTNDLHAKIQVFSLSLIFRLWGKPHYRNSSYKQDLLDNLKNVAIPGTGIPLSFFCHFKIVAMFLVYFINPFVCFCGAFNKAYIEAKNGDEMLELLGNYYIEHLLHPSDWFSLWRMNCRLVAYHSTITQSKEYGLEDKWTFLVQGKNNNVPVTPYFDQLDSLVCKHKHIEGGMGIHIFSNASHGGDYILQPILHNAKWLAALLPANPPLSTMRVITTSTYTLSEEYMQNKERSLRAMMKDDELDGDGDGVGLGLHAEGDVGKMPASAASGATANMIGGVDSGANNREVNQTPVRGDVAEAVGKYIEGRCAVLRLGRAGAKTDHSSVLFDVDMQTGEIRQGCSNSHWYHLGPTALFTTPWLPPLSGLTQHVDPPNPQVTGVRVPNMQEAMDICKSAHYRLMAEVPIIGWDVAFTTQGIFLLEVNLSCNFFRGHVDMPAYLTFLDRHFTHLTKIEKLENEAGLGAGGGLDSTGRVGGVLGGQK
eukprot:gene25835-31201_t